MRSIEFRGKNDHGWHYGMLTWERLSTTGWCRRIIDDSTYYDLEESEPSRKYGYIIRANPFDAGSYVQKDSIGQYTGMGYNKTYEGDIVQGRFPVQTWEGSKIVGGVLRDDIVAEVVFRGGQFCLDHMNIFPPDWIDDVHNSLMRYYYGCFDFKVIGNMTDNPEIKEEWAKRKREGKG